MRIVDQEFGRYVPVPSGEPDYQTRNPIVQMMERCAAVELAAEREHYDPDSIHYLFGVDALGLYGPNSGEMDPRRQDVKEDFQKQNIANFSLSETCLLRGYAAAGAWEGPFLKASYDGSPESTLAREARAKGQPLGANIRLWLRVNGTATPQPLVVPYNPANGRYELEIWAYPDSDLRSLLDAKGQASIDAGRLITAPWLVKGSRADFEGGQFSQERDNLNRQIAGANNPPPMNLIERFPDHAMHPIHPLRLELAWANNELTAWDSRNGRNHRYWFNMLFRGWKNYLQTGLSRHPHGGVGFLEYRNLLSNYFQLEQARQRALGPDWSGELGREVNPWNFDAHQIKPSATFRENFFAVDYMDLHLLNGKCGIGIHRHRDNQEVFLLLEGKALMLVGDWCEFPQRDRAFEIRPMNAGDLAICKTGQLHALYNHTDEQIKLFMFGGYD